VRHTLVYLTLAALSGPVQLAAAQQPASTVRDRIRAALELPSIVDSIRRRGGIPEEEVRVVVDEARRKNIPANETRDVLKEADNAIRDHGPVDNFGAFVKARLDAGLRGRALAQAIRQEHARRGIGKGNMRGAAGSQPGQRGQGARGAADTGTRGKSKAAGQPGGRPESPGAQGKSAGDTTKTKGKSKGRP
jgi:hypothetical protein